MSRRRVVSRLAGWAVVGSLFVSAGARAEEDARKRAARHFDAAVAQYERAAYADAARSFLAADEALPSPDALNNALNAARKARDHLLVVAIARRATSRGAPNDPLSVRAREALADAAAHLAKVELSCEPTPCVRQIDGVDAEGTEQYLQPGTHVFVAVGGAGARAEERTTLAPGATYAIRLYLTGPGAVARPNQVEKRATAATPAVERPARTGGQRPVSSTVFYVGVGMSVALAAVTAWSGFDTLAAKDDLGARPTPDDVDAVRGKALRTDVLLGATALMVAATTWAGVSLVDFGGPSKARVGLAPLPTALHFTGRF